jgi:shikimate dehydrogenase
MPGHPVFLLRDLDARPFPGTTLAVLGHPIAHSLSPPMHQAALAALAKQDHRFADWRYYRFDIHPTDLPTALDRLGSGGFRGLNLTVPHKVLAFDLVAEIDPAARAVGAVNTLLATPKGWYGTNTDGYGLSAAVRERLGCDLAGRTILLLGAGGAARGAAVECLQRGCARLIIGNRTARNLEELLALVRPLAGAIPLQGFDLADQRALAALPAETLVINATSVGLKAEDPAPLDLAALPRPAGVFDMIYNPPQTALLRQAASLGVPHANGLAMLVHQGAKSLELWSGAPADLTAPFMTAGLAAHAGKSLSLS